jgi:hypothetical protein
VAGDGGEIIFFRLNGRDERVGVSSGIRLQKSKFCELYPGWPGDDASVNLDIGLIEVDDVNKWTSTIGERELLGAMIDMPIANALSLIGCRVRGIGAASGQMLGEIHALFYRYNTRAGADYIADLLIGPRVSGLGSAKSPDFATYPGDSGTLWVIDQIDQRSRTPVPMPLALQWGRNMLYSAGQAKPQGFALATFLATACAQLNVDPIRDWNLDQPDTWGAVGHYAIAAKSVNALSNRFPKLVQLMNNNAEIISHDDSTILSSDFKGMGSEDFVAPADVPDFFWKPRIGQQGHTRPMEGPNHFADMDQPGPDGKSLLDLCEDPAFIDPDKWNDFYNSVTDLLKGEEIAPVRRGLLPFRVWQIFDAMVDYVSNGMVKQFVCAAGVLTNYLGDACQPLHISYLHDGDPLRKYEYTYQRGKKAGQSEWRPLGNGCHSAYEDEMVNANRQAILTALKSAPKAAKEEKVNSGYEAAQRTIDLMRATFERIHPMDIVNAFVAYKGKPKDRAVYMWNEFGDDTLKVMQGGAHLLAVLWESAWDLGDGDSTISSATALSEADAMKICADRDFIPSLSIGQIGATLRRP